MNSIWSTEVDVILSRGHSLDGLGIRNWALDKAAAYSALDELVSMGVGILGGDVYMQKNGGIHGNYDSWFCVASSGESDADFAVRSANEAREYISNYSMKDALFSVVPRII